MYLLYYTLLSFSLSLRQDRKVEGSGVVLYVRNTLMVKILEKSNTTQTAILMNFNHKLNILACCSI